MYKRLLAIFIVLILSINFIPALDEDPKNDIGSGSDVIDTPAADDNEEITSPVKTVDIVPVSIENPTGNSDVPTIKPGTRGIWNWSGQPMLEDGFEGAFPGPNWFAFDNLSNAENRSSDFWGLNDTRAKNGTYSLYCAASNATGDPSPPGNYSANHSGYDDNQKSWMITGPYDLSDPLMSNARLSFWYWIQTEIAPGGENDSLIWAASKDNKSYSGFMTRGNFSYWQHKEYDLTNYDGSGGSLIGESSVWLAFIFSSDGQNMAQTNYNYTGVWLDDVKFENYTNRAPTKPTSLNVSGPSIRRIVLDNPLFNWTFNDPDSGPAEGPSGYHIQVGIDENWTSVEKWNKKESGYFNPYIFYGSSNKLEDGQTYFFRVRARDMDRIWSPWSDTFNFSINDPPTEPTVISPNLNSLWEGGTQHYINWTVSTNDDNGTDDTIVINISFSINGGQTYTEIINTTPNDGEYLWTLPTGVERSDCRVQITAFDGYEETIAYSPLFKIDSLPPEINNIIASSNTTWYYEQPGMNGTGGTVWFNSLEGEGAYQEILLYVDWTDVSRTSLEGGFAFGDLPIDNDSMPEALSYTIEVNATDALGVKIKAVDFFGRFKEATIDFKMDNTDPTAPSNVVAHPDSFTDTGEVDDDNQVYITYVDGTDAGVGISHAKLDTKEPPTQTENNSNGRGLITSLSTNTNATIFVAMVDFVGNVGPATNDTIKIDLLAPNPPEIFSSSHPNNTFYYSNSNPEFNWTWPYDLSGVERFAVKLNTVSSYIPEPNPPVNDQTLTVNFTSYTDIPDGVNFFHVRSYDRAGHWGLGSSSFKIFIDTTPPYIDDTSDTSGLTGETVRFVTQAIDNGSGVKNNGKVHWRFEGDTTFNDIDLQLIDDKYRAEITANLYREGYIEYYFSFEDISIPPNSGIYPHSGYKKILIIDNKIPAVVWGTNDTFGYTGDPLNISILASDNVKPDRAYLYIEGWPGEFDMTESVTEANNFSAQIILPKFSLAPLRYYIEIYDGQNNMIRSPGFGFNTITVYDNDPPTILFVTGDVSKKNEESVTITVQPEDNVEAALVLTAKFYSGRTDALFSMVPVDDIDGFQYVFELSSEIKSDVDYYIIVEDTSGNSVRSPEDENELYHIYIPNILKPNGGEIWNLTQKITWHAPVIPGTTFSANLSYSSDSGESWVKFVTDLSNVESYDWDTTELEDSLAYLIRLEILYNNGIYCTDISDNEFIIYNPDKPQITIENPIKGEKVKGNTRVKWASTDADPTDKLEVDIYFKQLSSQGNGTFDNSWKALVENLAGTGEFTWQTLKFNDGDYNLRFVVFDGTFKVEAESGTVTIYNPDAPLVTVLEPTTNSIWTGKKTVTWIATDADFEELKISIYLRRVTDKNQSRLHEDLPNSGEITIDFSKYQEGIYEIIVEADDSSILEPTQSKSGVFDIQHEDTINLTTYAIVGALLAFMVVMILMLFLMARQRKKMLEKAKLTKKAKIKTKKKTAGADMPAQPMMGMPGMQMPQLPGAGFPMQQQPGVYAGGPTMTGEQAVQPQLPPGTIAETETAGDVVNGLEVPTEDVVDGEPVTAEIFDGEVVDGTDSPAVTEHPAVQTDMADASMLAGADAEAPAEDEPAEPKAGKKSFCGECGSQINESDVVCVQCGKFQS
jgi:hypothetical protein